MSVEFLNPSSTYDTLQSRGFSQVAVARQFSTLITLSGQLPLNRSGELVGAGDIEAQLRQVYDNLRIALRSAGADFPNIMKMTTYLTDIRAQLTAVRKVRREYFGDVAPPASTMYEVGALAPGVLIEVDAIAVL